MARRLRSAAARRREARFCGWLARGLWAGLHVAIIAVTLSANHGVAARIRHDMPYAASLAGVLSANVALFLYLCAADPGYIPVTDRRLGGPKQAALGGAVLRHIRRLLAAAGKLGATNRSAVNGDAAPLPVWQQPDPDPRAGGHHMLASASMLFESSFPDQVMLPAADVQDPRPSPPSTAGRGPSAAALTVQNGPGAPSRADDHRRQGRPHVDIVTATLAPTAVRGHDTDSVARHLQPAPSAKGGGLRSPVEHTALPSAWTSHRPAVDGRAESGDGEGEPAALSDGHLLSGGGVEDIEGQPLPDGVRRGSPMKGALSGAHCHELLRVHASHLLAGLLQQ